ncbi:MAG: NUDIX hydrolase YfcD [Bryobacteraceae bacterium]
MGNPSEEIVLVVDRDNNPVGSATRGEMRRQGLPHRSTYIAVFNSEGMIWVQRRTLTKDVYPGYLDPVSGGVVLAGETYEQSAERELFEEMGISGVPLEPQFDFWFEDGSSRVWGRAFRCTWDGPVRPQPEEVAEAILMTPGEVLAAADQCTPDGMLVIRKLLGAGGV